MSDYFDDFAEYETDPEEPVTATAERVVAEIVDDDPAPKPVAAHPVLRSVPGTDMPIVPLQDEARGLAQMAVTLCAAGNVPKALQNRPADLFLVLLTARDLGVSLTTAVREFHVIDGKVTCSPKVRMAMVRQQGLGKLWPDPGNDRREATWYGERYDQPGIRFHVCYTWEAAEAAKLTGKDNWRKYPERMLSWRALGYLLDDAFSEVGTGIYSPDEMGAVTDENGEPLIDLDNTDPLTPARRIRPGRASAAEQPANPADIARLQERVAVIKWCQPAADALRLLWMATDEHGRQRLAPLASLPAGDVKKAEAVIESIERRGAKGEWGVWPPEDPARPFDADVPSPIDAVAALDAGGVSVEPEAAGEAETDTEQGVVDGLADGPEFHDDNDPAGIVEPDTEPPVEVEWTAIERIIEWAKGIPVERLTDELRTAGLPVSGNNQAKRKRLAQHWIDQEPKLP